MNTIDFFDATRLEIQLEDGGELISGFFLDDDQYDILCKDIAELNVLRAEVKLLREWLNSELKFKNSFLKFTEGI